MGAVVAAASNARPTANKAFAARMKFEGNGDGKSIMKFHFGVPMVDARIGRVIDFRFHLPLNTAAPTAEKPWRMPK